MAPRRSLDPIRRLTSLLKPYIGTGSRRLVLVALLSLGSGFAEAGLLYLVVRAAITIAANETRVTGIGPWSDASLSIGSVLGFALAILVLLVVVSFVIARLTAALTSSALRKGRQRTFGAFMRAEWDLQSRERQGQLQDLLTTHVTRVAMGILVLINGAGAALTFFAFLVSAVAINASAALVIMICCVLLSTALFPLTRKTRRLSRKQKAIGSHYAMSVTESVNAAREIRVFGGTEEVIRRTAEEADRSAIAFFKTRFLLNFTPSLYQYAALALVLLGMAVLNGVGSQDISELGTIVLLLVRGLTYSQQISSAVQQAGEVVPYFEEIEKMHDRYEDRREGRRGERLVEVQTLGFDGVGYWYDEGVPVLDGVRFQVNARETIGIIGPSGSGKSTLVEILLGLRSPRLGSYTVNGVPSGHFHPDDWHREFVLVPQDNHLIRASVAENIRFFRPDLTDSQVIEAARLAHVHDEIARMPDGYETIVGSGAVELSGGQRQRLGLARALASRPSVLVLDEPTSALDMRSEQLVHQTLEGLRRSVLLFVVAHRMTTLRHCDRIMVFQHGKLVAFDTPDALARTNSFYQEVTRLSRLPA